MTTNEVGFGVKVIVTWFGDQIMEGRAAFVSSYFNSKSDFFTDSSVICCYLPHNPTQPKFKPLPQPTCGITRNSSPPACPCGAQAIRMDRVLERLKSLPQPPESGQSFNP